MALEELTEMFESFEKDFPEGLTFEPTGSLHQLMLILHVLDDDLQPLVGNTKWADLTGSQRRTVVRAVFAMIEGLTYCIKQTALELDDVIDHKLTATERMAINEETSRVDDSGQVKVRRESPALVGNVRFAFNMLAKVSGSEHVLDVGSEGWEAFRAAISLRDRITHPKQASDLEVTCDEISTLAAAHLWFHKALAKGLLLNARSMAIRRSSLEKHS